MMQTITPLSGSEFERVIRATIPIAGSRAEAEECVLDAQLKILTDSVDNPEDVTGLLIHISRHNALKRRRRGKRVISLDALDTWEHLPPRTSGHFQPDLHKAPDHRTFYLWPGSDVHIDLLAIAEDDHERQVLGVEIANLQGRGATDYVGLHRSFREWERESIIDVLREFGEQKGSCPVLADLSRFPSLPTLSVIYRFFNKWSDALRAAGFQPKRQSGSTSRWDRDTARKAYCEWVTRHGRLPTSADVATEQADLPSAMTLRRLFSSGGVLRLSVEINQLCLDAGCRHDWQPGRPHKSRTHSL